MAAPRHTNATSRMSTLSPRYLQQDSPQTLTEGLAEYASAHREQLTNRLNSEAARKFFDAHDTAHVVFGCGITLTDEAVVKVCSIFGTSEGFAVLRGYAAAESKNIYRELALSDIVATTIQSFALVPRAIWHCQRMRERWPWRDHQQFLDQPLHAIRTQFGIRVLHSHLCGD